MQAAAIRERQAIADAGRVADLQVQINRLKTRVGYVEVVGPDEYDLDSDGDGFACQS